MFKITHNNLCAAHNTDRNSITTFQPIVLQVLDTELVSSLAVNIGGLATRKDTTTVDAAVETQTGVDSIYGGTVSITTTTETGHETHGIECRVPGRTCDSCKHSGEGKCPTPPPLSRWQTPTFRIW